LLSLLSPWVSAPLLPLQFLVLLLLLLLQLLQLLLLLLLHLPLRVGVDQVGKKHVVKATS
jgi:hypothetical protein